MDGLRGSRGSGLLIFDLKQQSLLTLEESLRNDAAYSETTHLLAGFSDDYLRTEPTVIVYENRGGTFVRLYTLEADVNTQLQFSADGKYLILNLDNRTVDGTCSATVLDAFTGEKLLEVPNRLVSIIDDTIYDISVPYVPTNLPTAHFYTAKELAKLAGKSE